MAFIAVAGAQPLLVPGSQTGLNWAVPWTHRGLVPDTQASALRLSLHSVPGVKEMILHHPNLF